MLHYWVDRLEDPFEMFPMQSVARSLADSAKQQEERRFGRSDWYGVSPKYYTVEDEHDNEVVELLIGSVFVLGQAAITQAVSLVKRMHEVAGEPAWIPSDKESIMALESPIHAGTGLQKILIINAVANYFKHRHEWWDDWTGPKHSLKTIQIVSKLGLGPKGYHNLEHALRELEVYLPDMAPLAQLVVTWREQLAAHLRNELGARGL